MSDCGNVKKVFVPTEDKPVVNKTISTFDITETAIEKIGHFLQKDGKSSSEFGLRVQVVRDGCSGNSYDIQIGNISDAISAGDKIFEFKNVTVIIEKLSYMFVIGSQLDYVETLLMSGFQITNPNVKRSCSCGSSFSVK